MANFLKQLIENDKKDLKRLDHLASKVEALKDEMEKLTDEELVFGILAIIFAFIFPLAGLITGLIGWQRGEKFEIYYNKASKQKIASLIAIFIVLAQYLLQFLSALSNTI